LFNDSARIYEYTATNSKTIHKLDRIWGKKFPFFKNKMSVQTDSGAQPASYSMVSVVSSGDRAATVEVDYSHPSNGHVKNEWSYTSTLPVRLHG